MIFFFFKQKKRWKKIKWKIFTKICICYKHNDVRVLIHIGNARTKLTLRTKNLGSNLKKDPIAKTIYFLFFNFEKPKPNKSLHSKTQYMSTHSLSLSHTHTQTQHNICMNLVSSIIKSQRKSCNKRSNVESDRSEGNTESQTHTKLNQ